MIFKSKESLLKTFFYKKRVAAFHKKNGNEMNLALKKKVKEALKVSQVCWLKPQPTTFFTNSHKFFRQFSKDQEIFNYYDLSNSVSYEDFSFLIYNLHYKSMVKSS